MYNTSLKTRSANEKVLDFTVEKAKLDEMVKKAREMKSEDYDIGEIAKITRLSIEEIKKL